MLSKIKKKTILTLTLLVLTSTLSVNASSINTEKCKETLKSVFEEVNANVIDSRTVEGREQHLDSLFSILKSEYNSEKSGARLSSCFAVPLENDVAIKLIRMLYGENINKPLKLYASVWSTIWDKEVIVDEALLNEDTDFLNFIPDLIVSFNKIIFSIAVLLIAFIYGRSILQVLYEKDPKKLKNNAKNISKIVMGLSLIAPIAIFGDYSLIQFIFIMLIIFSILVAKVLWMLIVLSMNFSYMEKDITELVIEEGVMESYIKPLLDNVMIHACDIKRREEFLGEIQYQFNNEMTFLKENKYYQCLSSPATSDMFQTIQQENSHYPYEIMKGKYCAIKHQKIKVNETYCGNIKTAKRYRNSDPAISDLKEKAYKAMGIEDTVFQNKLREIAYETLILDCKTNGSNKINAKNADFVCPSLQLNSGKYNYDIKTDLIKFESSKTVEPLEIDSMYDSYAAKYIPELTEILKNKIPELASVVAQSKLKRDSTAEEIESFISLYEKGFAMAGTIFYERVNLLLVDREAVRTFKGVYDVYQPTGYFYMSLNNVLVETRESTILRGLLSLVSELPLLSDAAAYGTDTYLASTSENQFLKSWSDISSNQTNCIEDYQKCKLVAINPFLDLMDAGQEMMQDGLYMQIGVTIFNKIFSFVTSGNGVSGLVSQLLDFVSELLFLYTFVGFFFAILIPFIPFFIYASLIFGWIVQTLKVLLSSQLLSIYFIIPDEKEDFAGNESKIYKLLLKTALQPLLLLTGFLVSIMLANISITLINVWLSIIQETMGLNEEVTSVLTLLQNIIGVVMYAVFVTLAIIKSTEAISIIPKSMSKWLDIEIEEEKTFSHLKQIVEQHVVPHIKMSSIM
jgi:conjugal transfer/type IV secretion protein DotA/TraY